MSDTNKLFSEFKPTTKQEWIDKAIADLKGADFERKLIWRTDDGIQVQPFYTPEDLEGKEIHVIPKLPKERKWLNVIEIAVKDETQANDLARKMIDFGVEGFVFSIDNDKINLNTLLNNIDLSQYSVSFSSSTPFPELIKNYLSYANVKGLKASDINGYYECDVLESWSVKGVNPDFDAFSQLQEITADYPAFNSLVIKSHSFVNAGASAVQELAFTLNKLTDYLDKGDQEKVKEITFHMAIGGDYFFEIAKLRALRILADSILSLYTKEVPDIKVVSSNSIWSKSLYDPYVNMLRNTTEAMAAILGGCDAIVVQPHDSTYNAPTPFSHRIAANVSNLIKEESYFDKVVDPAAGSYYLETLTQELVDKTLEKFKEIENKGGYIKAFEQSIIQNEILELRSKKEKEISSRKQVYVGTNKYPNLNEKIESSIGSIESSTSDSLQLLAPQRAARGFEAMRQKTQIQYEKTGRLPQVYLACYGDRAMRKARAGFAAEFFGTAGFDVQPEQLFDSASEAAKQSAQSYADIVVICSSDPDYESDGVLFAEEFRKISKDKTLILAGFPKDIIEALKGAGVDDFIHIKTDVIDFITALQDKLFTNNKKN